MKGRFCKMFEVIASVDNFPIVHGLKYIVLDIINDKHGYPKFLVYAGGVWLWESAKYFMPTCYYKAAIDESKYE